MGGGRFFDFSDLFFAIPIHLTHAVAPSLHPLQADSRAVEVVVKTCSSFTNS